MFLQNMIEVMRAANSGTAIEFRLKNDKEWLNCDCPDWNWKNYEYRIKENQMSDTSIDHKIEAMQAFKDGKSIFCKDKHDRQWREVEDPSWNWGSFDYRVDEVQTIYVNIYGNGLSCSPYETRKEADKGSSKTRIACLKVEYRKGQFDS